METGPHVVFPPWQSRGGLALYSTVFGKQLRKGELMGSKMGFLGNPNVKK